MAQHWGYWHKKLEAVGNHLKQMLKRSLGGLGRGKRTVYFVLHKEILTPRDDGKALMEMS